MDSCPFCAEASGVDTPLAFADEVASGFPARFRPQRNVGAALVVTKDHFETLEDLPPEIVGPFFARVQQMAAAVRQVSGASGTTLIQNNHPPGQEVPHLHVHVVPRFPGDGWPLAETIQVSEHERTELANRLRQAIGTTYGGVTQRRR